MGCYQIVINDDNGRQSILLFLCWFVALIIAQTVRKCNHVSPIFTKPFNDLKNSALSMEHIDNDNDL
jgi:hypothetical protein